MLSPTRASRLLGILAAVAFVLAVIVARVVTSARAELGKAAAAMAQNDLDAAIVHYRRAARWYAPGSPYHVQALSALTRLGRSAEQAGDTARALLAYRAVRGSILAARSFYVPERERLAFANERIATLMSEQPPAGMDAGKEKAQIRREHLALLEHDPDPNVFWTLVLLFGFFAWVSAAFVFSVRAVDDRDRWVGAEVRKWGSVIVVGFTLFVLGMALA